MYGLSVYPAPISLTGPRRNRAPALSGRAGSEVGQRLMEDLLLSRTSDNCLSAASSTQRYLKCHFVFFIPTWASHRLPWLVNVINVDHLGSVCLDILDQRQLCQCGDNQVSCMYGFHTSFMAATNYNLVLWAVIRWNIVIFKKREKEKKPNIKCLVLSTTQRHSVYCHRGLKKKENYIIREAEKREFDIVLQ